MFASKRKAQMGLEFMTILLFILIIMAAVMYVTGILLVENKELEKKKIVENFAESIQKELDILSQVEGGYYRELPIIQTQFHVNITHGMLILKDLDNGNKTYYYDLMGDYNVTLGWANDTGYNHTVIIFEKEYVNNYEGRNIG